MAVANDYELYGHPSPVTVEPRRTWAWLAAGVTVASVMVGVATAENALLGLVAFSVLVVIPAIVLMPKLVAFLLVLTVFYGEAVTFGTLTPNRLVAPLAVLAILVQLMNTPAVLPDSLRTLQVVGAYSLLALASLAWTVDVSSTIYSLASLAIALTFMGVFALVIRDEKDFRQVLVAITISATALALWWIVSYLGGVDRFTNEAGDPNYFATYQVVALPLVLVLASSTKSPLRSFWLYVATGIIAISIVSTLSRGGVLTLAVAGFLMMILPARSLFRSRVQKFAFAFVGLIALGTILSIAWIDLAGRFGAQYGRQGLWLAAIEGYQQNPVTGLGFGAFEGVSYELLSNTPGVELEEHLMTALLEGREVHNVYLGSLAELGPLGLLLFVGILVSAIRALRRTARRADASGTQFVHSVANALVVGLSAFAVSSLFLSSETRTGLWMLVGLTLALPRLLRDHSSAAGDDRLGEEGKSPA